MRTVRTAVVAAVVVSLLTHTSVASAQHVVWLDQFGSRAPDEAFHVATDADGSSFVVGRTFGAFEGFTNAGASDAFVVVVAADGTAGATLQFGTAGEDVATGVAIDAAGAAYVVGGVEGALRGESRGSLDAFARKLRPNGTFAWTRQFGTTGYDIATAVDVHGRRIYVGSLWNGGGSGVIRRYSTSGDPIWKRRIPAGWQVPVAADRTGVYIAGAVEGEASNEDLDVFVRAFDHNGDIQWTRRFGTPDVDQPLGLDVREGVVYVAGHTRGSLDGANQGIGDAFVRTFDTDGRVMWTRQWGTANSDWAWDVEVDTSSNAYVVGFLAGEADQDAFVTKLDPNGDEIWTTLLSSANQEEARGVSIAGTFVSVAGSTNGELEPSAGGPPTGVDAFVAAVGTD
jgi:hypothetical protein